MDKSTSYQKQSKMQRILEGIKGNLDTENDITATAIESLKDVAIGVVAGGILAKQLGKPSFLLGLAATGFGHYTKNKMLTTFGLGLMASNSVVKTGLNGVDGFKEKALEFKDEFLEKTYLDKVFKSKKTAPVPAPIAGLGQVQYFSYPASDKALDMGSLDAIEQQINDSALAYSEQVRGEDQEIEGFEQEIIY